MTRSNKTVFLLGVAAMAITSCNRQQEIYPQRKIIQQAVFASGYLQQEDEYVIAATADGTIKELNIRAGDHITTGQVLVRIKSDVTDNQLKEALVVYDDARRNTSAGAPQLAQIQAQINLARIQLQQDKITYERYAELREKNSVSQLEFEKAGLQYKASESNLQVLEKSYTQVEETLKLNAARSLQQVKTQQAVLDEYMLGADKAGVVLDVVKKKGELVRRGELIAKVGSGRYLLKLFIAEDDITKVSAGQEVIVQMNNYPDTTFTAVITKILPAFYPGEQSYVAEAVFRNPPPLLLSGTQLQANIKQQGTRSVLVIPAPALIRSKYVQLENGEEKEIQTGQKFGNWVEVRSGITENDVILLPRGKNKKDGITMPGTE